MDEGLNVALFCTWNWRVHDAEYPCTKRFGVVLDALDGLSAGGLVFHDTAFGDEGLTHLELRLDQEDCLGRRLCNSLDGGQYF